MCFNYGYNASWSISNAAHFQKFFHRTVAKDSRSPKRQTSILRVLALDTFDSFVSYCVICISSVRESVGGTFSFLSHLEISIENNVIFSREQIFPTTTIDFVQMNTNIFNYRVRMFCLHVIDTFNRNRCVQ